MKIIEDVIAITIVGLINFFRNPIVQMIIASVLVFAAFYFGTRLLILITRW